MFLKAPLLQVAIKGSTLTAIQVANRSLTARVFIDASYEGDLMSMSGVDCTVGQESQAQYGEPLTGRRPLVPGQCYGFHTSVDPFVSPGSTQTLPMVWGGALGSVGEADTKVMSYNYRLCLTNATASRLV